MTDIRMRAKQAGKAIALMALIALAGIGAALALVSSLRVTETPPVASVSAAGVFSLTNDERTDRGVVALQRNALLDQAAQMKAQDMAAKGYYAHVSPEGLTPMHWVEKSGYRYLVIGENLVVNRKDDGEVVDAFMGSPGHRANILRKDFTEIGVGVASGSYKGKDATFAVQIFAAPYPRPAAPAAAAPKPAVKPVPAPSTPLPAPAPKPVPTVPRTVVTPAPARPAVASTTATTSPSLQERVSRAIGPIVSVIQGTSSPATSTDIAAAFDTPPFLLEDLSPVELADVSQLETLTPPVPIGSVWTMQFRSFLDGMMLRARSMFGA